MDRRGRNCLSLHGHSDAFSLSAPSHPAFCQAIVNMKQATAHRNHLERPLTHIRAYVLRSRHGTLE
jgi:hypothetical protein